MLMMLIIGNILINVAVNTFLIVDRETSTFYIDRIKDRETNIFYIDRMKDREINIFNHLHCSLLDRLNVRGLSKKMGILL